MPPENIGKPKAVRCFKEVKMGTLERNGLIKNIVQCLKSFGNSLVLPYRLFKIARVNLSIYNFSTLLAESGR